jgi:hypothetical protein
LEVVSAIDEAMAELFYPQKMENRQTTELCHELSIGVATTLLTELINPKKSTHNYINNGMLAFNNLSLAEKEASLGMRANNDPSKGNFATFTDVLFNSGRISIDSAAGIGQARYNKDLNRNHGRFVTGRKDKGTRTDRLQKLVPSICCLRNCKIHCLPLQRRMGIDQGGSSLPHCVDRERLVQPRPLMLLQ